MNFLTQQRNSNELVEPRVSFDEIPISALRSRTKEKLSNLLDTHKVLVTEDGHSRDWRGIFALSGLTQSDFSSINQSRDKMGKLLDLWISQNKENDSVVTLSQLQKCFGVIDRYDVYDDTFILFTEDSKAFLSKSHRDIRSAKSMEIMKADVDNDIITIGDLQCSEKDLPLKIYDAFVIYSDKDVEFATELVERCENMGFSLCVKDRDLLGGITMESDAILSLVANRCRKVIVIVSKAFLNSPMKVFITNFAQAEGISHGDRKIIPCILEHCDLPQMLRYSFHLDYYKNNKLFNFWEKLNESLRSKNLNGRNNRFSTHEIEAGALNMKMKIPDSPGPLYDKDQGYKFTDTPTPAATKNSKIFLFGTSEEELEDKRQIWPPPPQLRAASSMVDLTNANGKSFHNKLSQSTFHLNETDDAALEGIKTKRKKWYKKFLPPSSKDQIKVHKIKTINEEPEISPLRIDKRPWYKISKKKSKQKIAVECDA